MLTHIIENSAKLLGAVNDTIDQLLREVNAEAIALKAHFYCQKEALHKEELRKLEQMPDVPTKARKPAYAPLNFSTRVEDARLEMSWWTLHFSSKGSELKQRVPWGMPKSKEQRGYYLPTLLKEAKWDAGLVKEVEAHAVTLREARAALLELRTKFGVYRRLLERPNAMSRRDGA